MARAGRGRPAASPSGSDSGSSSRSRSSSGSDSRSRSRSVSKSFSSSASSPSCSASSASRSPPLKKSPSGVARRGRSPVVAKRASPAPRKASPLLESVVLHVDQLTRNVNEGHLKEIFDIYREEAEAGAGVGVGLLLLLDPGELVLLTSDLPLLIAMLLLIEGIVVGVTGWW